MIKSIQDIVNNITILSEENILYYSSYFNYKDGINFAYEKGATINNQNKMTLVFLIRNSDIDSIQKFSNTFDQEMINYGLFESVDDFNLKMTDYFIRIGADINTLNDFTLHLIIICGEFKLAKYLFTHGANFNNLNPKYSINGNLEIFKRYIKLTKLCK